MNETRLMEVVGLAVDVGRGHAALTLIMPLVDPASTFIGFDAHGCSVDVARTREAEAGGDRSGQFAEATAKSFRASFDLGCFFDCLHDMGDLSGGDAVQSGVRGKSVEVN